MDIIALEQKILKHNERYTDGVPLISDSVYDQLIDTLRKYHPSSEVLKKVGADTKTAQKGTLFAHTIEMGSLEKINTELDLLKWLGSLPQQSQNLIAQLKLDGCSIELIYDKCGKLKRAVTRGDGIEGVIVTYAVSKMQYVPLEIPPTGELQSFGGEAIISKENFPILSQRRKERGKTEYANPRNAVSGILGAKDPIGAEYIDFICFKTSKPLNEDKKISYLRDIGFKPVDSLMLSRDKIQQAFEKFTENRDALPYEIDGIVIKINEVDQQEELGSKDLRPLWARAYKFENQSTTSTVVDISWSVGSTGRINPIIHIEPVDLMGVTITNITGNNLDYMTEKGISKGAEVVISRRNDVIPAVEETITVGIKPVEAPSECPECGSPLEKDRALLFCKKRTKCPGALNGQLMNFIRAKEWKGIGDISLRKLINSGKITEPSDFFTIPIEELAEAIGSTKNAEKIKRDITAKAEMTVAEIIGTVGIPGMKKSRCEALISAGYDTVDSIFNLTTSQIQSIEGFGDILSQQLVEGLAEQQEWVRNLLEVVKIKETKTSDELSGHGYQITGKMHKGKRADYEKQVKERGGVVGWKSHLKNTLVINDPTSTSKKAEKARKMGYNLISEDELLAIIQS